MDRFAVRLKRGKQLPLLMYTGTVFSRTALFERMSCMRFLIDSDIKLPLYAAGYTVRL